MALDNISLSKSAKLELSDEVCICYSHFRRGEKGIEFFYDKLVVMLVSCHHD